MAIISPQEIKKISQPQSFGDVVKTILKKQYSPQNVLSVIDPFKFIRVFNKTYLYDSGTKRVFPASPVYEMRRISSLPKNSKERKDAEIALMMDLTTKMVLFGGVSQAPVPVKSIPAVRTYATLLRGLKKYNLPENPNQQQIGRAFETAILKSEGNLEKVRKVLKDFRILDRVKPVEVIKDTEGVVRWFNDLLSSKVQAPQPQPQEQFKLGIGEGRVSQTEKAIIAQRKIGAEEARAVEKYKPKEVLPGGVLRGTPLGGVMPTPVEEAIKAKEIISPEEIKKMAKPKEVIPKELEPLAQEARKYKSNLPVELVDTRPKISFEEWVKNKLPDYSVEKHTRAIAEGVGGLGTERTAHGMGKVKSFFRWLQKVQDLQKEFNTLVKTGKIKSEEYVRQIIQPGTPQYEASRRVFEKRLSSYGLVPSDFYTQATQGVGGEGEVKEPIAEKVLKVQEKILAEARGELKAQKIEVMKPSVDTRAISKLMKATKEGVWSVPKTYPNGTKIRWDEIGEDLGYSMETTEINGVEIRKDLYDDLVYLKGGQPSAPKEKVIMPKVSGKRLARLKNTAEALGLEKEFYKVLEGQGIETATIPSYKRLKPYLPAEAVDAKPTLKVKEKIKERQAKAEVKTAEQSFKEWQDSYKEETISPSQAVNKAATQIKNLTNQGVKERLNQEVARIFAPDYRTPEYVFEKFGLKEKIYTPLKAGQERVSKELYHYTKRSNLWWQKIGRNNRQRKAASSKIFKWLDGNETVELTQDQLVVARQMKDYLASWADRLGLPEDRRIANYITHIFEPDFAGLKRVFPDELAKILDYVTPNKEFNPFLEKRLGAKGYKEDVFEAIDAYVYRGARKLHLDAALEQAASYVDALPLQASRYTDNFLKRFKNRPSNFEKWLDQNIIQPLPPQIKSFLGRRVSSKLTNLATSQIYRATLGFNLGSSLKNLTQGVNTFAELGSKYTVIGYSQLLSRGIKELKDEEVLSDMVIADYKNTNFRNALGKIDSSLFWFFDTTEKINRGAAYFATKQKFLDQGIPEEEAIVKAKEIVRKTQFAYGKLDTPLALQTPGGKLFFTLATYPLKQFEFMAGYAQKREWAKLARYIIASFAIVYGVGEYLGVDYKDVFFKNVLPGLGPIPSTIKNMAGPEWEREKAIKNLLAMLTIPGMAQMKKFRSVLLGESRTAPSKKYPKGQLRFKIETPQDIIKTLLSGEWSTSGAEKYLIKKGLKSGRTFIDDLLYIITGKKEYAPKKKAEIPNTKAMLAEDSAKFSLIKQAYALEGQEHISGSSESKERNYKIMAGLRNKNPEWYYKNFTPEDEKRLTGKTLELEGFSFGRDFPDKFKNYVLIAARERNLNPAILAAILAQESGGKGFDPKTRVGNDRGIAQINSDAFPEITDEQAFDPEFSINFLAKKMAEYLKYFNGDINRAIAAWNVGRGGASVKGPHKFGGGPLGQKYVDNVARNLTKELREKLGFKTTYA